MAEQGIERAFKYCSCALIEEYIRGREIELAVMEKDGGLIVTRAGEIGYRGEFYDYDTKYRSKDVEYIIPAKIDEKTEKYLRECAKKLFYSLGCRDLCRVDFFLTDGGEVIFNEVNTMPGFTESSMFPMLMRDMGYSMGEIIDSLVKNAIVKF